MTIALISNILLLGILAASAWMDIRSFSLPIWFLAASAVCGTALQLISGEHGVLQLLMGFIPGLVMAGIAFLSRRAVGYGDAIMLAACGSFLGLENTIWLLLISMSICALCSLCLLIFMKKDGHTRLPFMPFLLSGYICLSAIL